MHTTAKVAGASYALPSKVTELQDSRLWIQEEILRLYVPMTHPIGMDVRQGPKQLIHVELHR